MLTFNEYMLEKATAPRPFAPTNAPAPVLESLSQAGLLPSTLPQSPSVAEVATLLISKIAEMHKMLVAGPATVNEKRISYQNLNAGFLALLALSGSFPQATEEQQ